MLSQHVRPSRKASAQRPRLVRLNILNEHDLTFAELEVDLVAGLDTDYIADRLGDDNLALLANTNSHT